VINCIGFFLLKSDMNKYLSLVKFSHTIFALPFACIGFFLATLLPHSNGFSVIKFMLVICCMVTARSAAMAFNRYIDRDIDAKNLRTAIREIPSGQVPVSNVKYFILINGVLFVFFTYLINPLCFYLSPIALTIVLGYSYTKRFTYLCHLFLGLGLALAPIGAYIAVAAHFDKTPVFFGLAVLFWVSGFDIIYALQDEEFDRKEGLNSIPVLLGRKNALLLSRVLHVMSSLFLITAYCMARADYTSLHFISLAGLISFILMLVYQHSLVSEKDLSKINLAFFTTNGIASLVFGSLMIADLYL
jgi:4-hydroxybenzoate polyprenyltransferase